VTLSCRDKKARLLRRRKDDLAVTPLIGPSEAAKRRGISETASPNEQTRLAVTLSCRGKKRGCFGNETTTSQRQRKGQNDDLAVTPILCHREERSDEAVSRFPKAEEKRDCFAFLLSLRAERSSLVFPQGERGDCFAQ